jgi:beta-mannosidase
VQLERADRLLPTAAPVDPHSDFASVAVAPSIDWSEEPKTALPPGSGRIEIDLGGRWERRTADGEWRKVVVPDNFGFDEEFSQYFDWMEYRRKLDDPRLDAPLGSPQRSRLRFAAVDYFAEVLLNGELLGTHEGYFAPFGFDVTDRLQRTNELVVRVRDPLEELDPDQFFFFHRKRVIKGTMKYHDSRPGGLPGRMTKPLRGDDSPTVWTPEWGQSMTTAGITGPVTLVRTGDVAVDALFATPLDLRTLQLAAIGTNHGEPRDVRLHLSIGGEPAVLALALPAGPWRVDTVATGLELEPWSPVHTADGRPALHELEAVIDDGGRASDRRRTTFGLRTSRVATDTGGHAMHLEVNRDPVFVKAVNYIPWQHFAEVGRAFYDRDMRMIADAYGNSVGVHAHIQSPHCYDAADAAGMLVFQDFPLQWFYDSGTDTNPGFIDGARRQIAEMAYLLHPHPSVVYYACHNEPLRQFIPTAPDDDTPERDLGERHLDAALFETLSAIDPSRHVHEASGIGDDVHSYRGSLAGGVVYEVSEDPAWFVSEYGFWTVGPQAERFRDDGWPPTVEQMRSWVSRLSFIGSTTGYAGMPDRYPSLAAWRDATLEYGAALAKHQTEWFRMYRGDPYMGYRWHFWSDWWGYAGGGLVDVDRVPKRTYEAFRAASRPLLVTGRVERSMFEPGTVVIPIVGVNDTVDDWDNTIQWEVRDATSAVIAPDREGFRIGFAVPDDRVCVAVPRVLGATVAQGTITAAVPRTAATEIGSVAVDLTRGSARTLLLQWGGETNFVHLHCPADGDEHPPGMHDVVW